MRPCAVQEHNIEKKHLELNSSHSLTLSTKQLSIPDSKEHVLKESSKHHLRQSPCWILSKFL